MDTQSEASFDQIALLASQICQTPVALVSLLDGKRQWFKARVGLSETETPRELALCAHAILQEDILEVPDARNDYRFADSPIVKGGPKVTFYAGAPLVSPEGYPVGTLCVIDSKPHSLTESQRSALKILAQQTIAQLELRKHVARLTETIVQVHDTKRALREEIKRSEIARQEAEQAQAEAERANQVRERGGRVVQSVRLKIALLSLICSHLFAIDCLALLHSIVDTGQIRIPRPVSNITQGRERKLIHRRLS